MQVPDWLRALFAFANQASDDFLWSDALEWWHENALSLAIVFVFVCGLGSCTFFMGKAAISSATAEEGTHGRENTRAASGNPWSFEDGKGTRSK